MKVQFLKAAAITLGCLASSVVAYSNSEDYDAPAVVSKNDIQNVAAGAAMVAVDESRYYYDYDDRRRARGRVRRSVRRGVRRYGRRNGYGSSSWYSDRSYRGRGRSRARRFVRNNCGEGPYGYTRRSRSTRSGCKLSSRGKRAVRRTSRRVRNRYGRSRYDRRRGYDSWTSYDEDEDNQDNGREEFGASQTAETTVAPPTTTVVSSKSSKEDRKAKKEARKEEKEARKAERMSGKASKAPSAPEAATTAATTASSAAARAAVA